MSRIVVALAVLLSAGLVTATDPLPWPMQPQDGTHTLLHGYGDYHRPWFEVTGSEPIINFHFGVDLVDPTPYVEDDPAEDVYCVRTGFVTDVFWEAEEPDPPAAHDNYGIVICDFEGQQTGYGWCYQHIEDRLYALYSGNPWAEDEQIFASDRIGDIDNDAYPDPLDHLHFMRSAPEYDGRVPAVLIGFGVFSQHEVEHASRAEAPADKNVHPVAVARFRARPVPGRLEPRYLQSDGDHGLAQP